MENKESQNRDVIDETAKTKSGYLKYFTYFLAICVCMCTYGCFSGGFKDSGSSSSGGKLTRSYSKEAKESSNSSTGGKSTRSLEDVLLPYAQKHELTKEDFSKLVAMFKALNLSTDRIGEIDSAGSGIIVISAPKEYVKEPLRFQLNMTRSGSPSLAYDHYVIYKDGKKVNDMNMLYTTKETSAQIQASLENVLKTLKPGYKNGKLLSWQHEKPLPVMPSSPQQKWYKTYSLKVNYECTKEVIGKSDEVVKGTLLYCWDDYKKELFIPGI